MIALLSARRLAAAGVAVVGLVATMPPATAAPVPYSDPAVTGSVGLCDKSGTPVTGGNVSDRPFVWRAVSSVKAPDGYSGNGRKATLLAYQPRPGVPADQWSGDQLTATSSYTNPDYPMSQATPDDFTLNDFLHEFTPKVDGLLQLRLYFGIPGRGTWNTSYPATDIQVTGDTWHVVQGASVACTKGDSTSSEYDTLAPPSGAGGAATKPSQVQRSTSAAATSTKKPSSSPSAKTNASAASTSAAAGPETSASAQHTSSSASPLIGVFAAALVIAAGGAVWWRRRIKQ